jgi:MFS family permease
MSEPGPSRGWKVSPAYAWLVFALTFGLLLSDYMSRQVLVSVFPQLKIDWRLSDGQLGSLVGIVALMVGLLAFPLSVLADRVGRVRAIAFMALLWSLSTAACGLAMRYDQMFLARLCVGVGEAAYGSVGAAVLFSIFPPALRGTVAGAFMAGGVFGSVAGLGLGGAVAERFGWRTAFLAMAAVGVVLALAYLLIVSETRLGTHRAEAGGGPRFLSRAGLADLFNGLFSAPAARFAYLGSGLQLFLSASMLAWLPSHLHRAYGLDSARAASLGGAFLLLSALGMIFCGMVTDRASRTVAARKATLSGVYCTASGLLLAAAFFLPVGGVQLAAIGLGMILSAGSSGPAGAIVADATPVRLHASVMAALTLANNLLGLAPGPVVTGLLADRLGLGTALRIIPWIGLASGLAFFLCAATYRREAVCPASSCPA